MKLITIKTLQTNTKFLNFTLLGDSLAKILPLT